MENLETLVQEEQNKFKNDEYGQTPYGPMKTPYGPMKIRYKQMKIPYGLMETPYGPKMQNQQPRPEHTD